MLLTLIRKEWMDHILSLRFALVCVFCLVAIVSSVYVIILEYERALIEYRTSTAAHEKEIADYKSFGVQGIRIEKPLNPLQIFTRGIHRTLTGTALVSSWLRYEPFHEPAYGGNLISHLFPTFDFSFFVAMAMGLLVIAFSYDAFSGEKEQATLRLLMSFSVPRSQILLAKWIGGYLALALPFLTSFLCGLVIFTFSFVQLTGIQWTALSLIVLVSLLYLAAIYTLGLLVSAQTTQTSTSIMFLLLLWVFMSLIVPNLAPYLAAHLSPTHSPYLVVKNKHLVEIEERRKYDDALTAWEQKDPMSSKIAQREKRRELENYHYTQIADRKKRINAQFRRQMNAQIDLARNLSRISPLASFVYAASDLADSGVETYRRYEDTLIDYQRDLKTFVYTAWDRMRKTGGELNIEGYPRLLYVETPLQNRIENILIDLLLLVIWNAVFFLGAYVSFLKYDVR